jgi:uncharacterized protein (TIGR02147 family)
MTIFDYSDYKAYLTEFIAALPKKGRGQINRMAEYIGVHPTLISQVLNGQRDLSQEQIHKLCGYLGLQPLESDFLILLLQFERAGTVELKKYYKGKLDEAKKASLNIGRRLEKRRELTDLERSIFYSNWLYLAVWLFLSVDDGQTLEAVTHRFAISRQQASVILNFLKNCQLCSEESGIFQMKSQHIHLEFGSPFLNRHHTNWRIKSMAQMESLNEEEMMFTSPFSISRKDFARIREELMKLIKSTSAVIKDSPAEEIACLNLELFWIR